MADKKSTGLSRLATRRKERALEKKKEEEVVEKGKEEKRPDKGPMEEKAEVNGEPTEIGAGATVNRAVTNGGSGAGATVNGAKADELKVEPMELPPWEIIEGDRIDPFFFKFQFKNVEYSSGRNKTFLCYLVDQGRSAEGMLRGYLEDEHSGAHAEEAFFLQTLPQYDPALKYTITWYVSSSPCAACAAKLVEILQARKSLYLTIFSARLFEWEEPEIQAGLKALVAGGCKLRIMKPLDFSYAWDTFVEGEDEHFTPWEDCQENYEYYQEKLADILQ